MVKKTAVNKGTPAPAQAAPEAVLTAESVLLNSTKQETVIDTLTPNEQEFLQAVRRGKGIQAEEKAERAARVDEAAEKLKALESAEDIDKALDFIGRITGDGGQFQPVKSEADNHTFRRLALHLATSLWMDWFDVDTLFEGGDMAEEEEAGNLMILAPYLNDRIWEAFNGGMVDDNSVLNWINSQGAKAFYHAEWVDDRGVPVWLGRDSLKKRQDTAAKVEADE